jgi:hypothetical protein
LTSWHVSLLDHTTKHPPGPGVLAAIVGALNAQTHSDFGPAWGLAVPNVHLGGTGVPIHLFDNPDVAGALGYHDVDPNGLPYAHVFTDPSFEQGGSDWISGPYAVSSVISHELLEMLGDPVANRFAFDGQATLWCQEACDAVEASSYPRHGIPVSDFVLPAWFNPNHAGPFDYLGHLPGPFTIEAGGYSIVEQAGQEGQVTAEVLFDEVMPQWRRDLKLSGYGRTFWRLAMAASHSGGPTA